MAVALRVSGLCILRPVQATRATWSSLFSGGLRGRLFLLHDFGQVAVHRRTASSPLILIRADQVVVDGMDGNRMPPAAVPLRVVPGRQANRWYFPSADSTIQ